MKVDYKSIQDIAQQIATKFNPLKVVLFGSYAYGNLREDSDVDLLVIMDFDTSPTRQAVNLPSYNVSSKRYLVETSLLEKIAKAEKVVMRVDLARDYMDAVCTNEKTSGSDIPAASTSYGIRKFLENAAHIKEP